MSKTKGSPGLPKLLGGSQDERDVAAAQIEQIRVIQREWAPSIIAMGVFGESELWGEALDVLARQNTRVAEVEQQLDAFFQEDEARDARIPSPQEDSPDYHESLSEVILARAAGWGDVGFRLGLAVGMLLGPHAFGKGGAR